MEVFPGPDGRVRNVVVKTPDGDYRRPITKIVVLYPAEGYDEDETTSWRRRMLQ